MKGEKEFDLSKRIQIPDEEERSYDFIRIYDVKEFIRRLKEELMNSCDNKADGLLINQLIDKLAGEKLTK